MKNNKSTKKESILRFLELASIIFKEKDYIPSEEILEKYSNIKPEEAEPGVNLTKRIENSLKSILKKTVFDSKPGKGFRLKPQYREDLSWMLPLISRYLILADPDSLNILFEPMTYQLKTESLYNLFLLIVAKNNRIPVEFDYTKYKENTTKRRILYVYSIVQRVDLLIMGHEVESKLNKHFIFHQIHNIKLLPDKGKFPAPEPQMVDSFYENCIKNYKGSTLHNVTIRFTPDSKTFIHKEFFQKNQIIDEQNDGSYLLRLKAYSKEEVFRIITQFMDYTELLEPADWQKEFIERIENLLKRHKKI